MTSTTPAAPFVHAIRLRELPHGLAATSDYSYELPALREIARIELDPRVTFLIGEFVGSAGRVTRARARGRAAQRPSRAR